MKIIFTVPAATPEINPALVIEAIVGSDDNQGEAAGVVDAANVPDPPTQSEVRPAVIVGLTLTVML